MFSQTSIRSQEALVGQSVLIASDLLVPSPCIITHIAADRFLLATVLCGLFCIVHGIRISSVGTCCEHLPVLVNRKV